MNGAPNLPEWAAWLTALLILAGAAITLTGAIGLVRLQSFYERVHAPTLGGTLGAGLILLSSMLCFSVLQSRPILHEILIAAFITLTTPVTLILLVRAALYRDRAEGREDVPRDE
jgi:multicomponent K+:H+ antiporter subunit G